MRDACGMDAGRRSHLITRAMSTVVSAFAAGCMLIFASHLSAQESQTRSADSAMARAIASAERPALERGSRVRLTLVDRRAILGEHDRLVGSFPTFQGELVSIDSAHVDLRLDSRETITFPSSAIQRLEIRTGRGTCRRSSRARVACALGGVLGAAAVGAWAGDKVARQLHDPRTRWRVRGGLTGAVLMSVFLPQIGRDRWTEVALR